MNMLEKHLIANIAPAALPENMISANDWRITVLTDRAHPGWTVSHHGQDHPRPEGESEGQLCCPVRRRREGLP